MKILVNGREAVLKANASFEYVSENPLFTEAEDYTMEIPFPMKDCPQNISIFGPLHVKGVDISKVSFPCEIQTDAFVKSGILTITSVSDTEVMGQFLEGASILNFNKTLSMIKLTDMDFSDYDGTDGTAISRSRVEGNGWENLAVWNASAKKIDYAHNDNNAHGNTHHRHIYLWKLLELVAAKVGYSLDKSYLESNPMFKQALVVNYIPAVLDTVLSGYYALNRALPEWTVKEFFNQISLFFGCVVSYCNDHVTFVPYFSMDASDIYSIEVTDDFSVDLSSSEDAIYRGNKRYKLPDACNPNNYNMCSWFIENRERYPYNIINITSTEFSEHTFNAFWEYYSPSVTFLLQNRSSLFYFTDLKVYAIITKLTEEFHPNKPNEPARRLFVEYEILNQYGDFRDGEELGITPCPTIIIQTWIPPTLDSCSKPDKGGYTEMGDFISHYKLATLDTIHHKHDDFLNSDSDFENPHEVLIEGEDKTEFYTNLWIVLHNGEKDEHGYNINTRKYEVEGPDGYLLSDSAAVEYGGYKGEPPLYNCKVDTYEHVLNPAVSNTAISVLPKVDETKLYRYKFLAKTLPSPTSVFLIKGKRYACLKLTAQITVKGMSELVEGEFYEIID